MADQLDNKSKECSKLRNDLETAHVAISDKQAQMDKIKSEMDFELQRITQKQTTDAAVMTERLSKLEAENDRMKLYQQLYQNGSTAEPLGRKSGFGEHNESRFPAAAE